jgi:predicted 2-oxoglutarate/Fe(II)-dependent dioxygenase YbiX
MWDKEKIDPLKDKDGNAIYDVWGNTVPPDGHYTDNKDMAGKIRKLSVTLNLVDSSKYKGGNLRFDFGPHADKKRFHTCTEIRPRGSIIVFPSFEYHQVTPVTQGTRYSLVAWCLGKPFV